MNNVEGLKSYFANMNVDVSDHVINNRLLYLLPHTFHPDLMEREFKRMLDEEEKQDDINPSKFLREEILDQIRSVQVLVVGNSSKE